MYDPYNGIMPAILEHCTAFLCCTSLVKIPVTVLYRGNVQIIKHVQNSFMVCTFLAVKNMQCKYSASHRIVNKFDYKHITLVML